MIYNFENGKLCVSPNGEIDIANAEVFKANCIGILEEHKTGLVLDCANLSFIDSTALGAIVAINKKLGGYGEKLVIRNLKPHIQKLFRITNLDASIVIEP
jgi:anti-sigma B factor antagonist